MKTVYVAHIFSASNASELAETAPGIASGKKRRGAALPPTRIPATLRRRSQNCYEFWTKVVDAQPSVNVTGIARGRWTDITRINDGERMIATCSCCKDRGDVRTTKTGLGLWKLDSPYCPNCGVKMQEVE